ncbi:hypothetical protein [Burkholderia cenocepacia]|uniref:hypothetical protein n=1 Tax=Burkholderia cenocepacia TaxID=95486 RepID=UPI0038CC098F
MSKFATGQQVRVTRIHPHYPGSSTMPGDIGTVDGGWPAGAHQVRVRMATGKFAGDMRIIEEDRLELHTPTKGYVLLQEGGHEVPLSTQHADLEAALTWLRDNRINGRFEVLHVTKGDTYEARTEVQRV